VDAQGIYAMNERKGLFPTQTGEHPDTTVYEQKSVPQPVEDYHVPEQAVGNPVEERALDALRKGEVPTGADIKDKKKFSRRALIGGSLAAVVLAAGTTIGVKALGPNEGGNNLPPENAPGTSAPQVPGQTETVTTTPEKEITAETVPFTVNGKEVIGVNTMTGIAAELQVTRPNDPKLPAPSEAEGMQYLKGWLHGLQEVANMPITAENEKFVAAADQAVLYHEGTTGAVQQFIHRIQTQPEREKITSIEMPKSLFGKPDKVNVAQAQAYVTTQDATGKQRRYYVSVALEAQWGVVKVGNTNRVELVEPK